ncbi:BPL-N domain-containing protein [Thalassoroseus pseudoceratinae]|uniref:BPL-N domain-containing protein n=1 Tax=Thalassoroseus pseudoceratinae TaxID=2713176 RepID=UPI00141F3846|nr:BPL-N domain-containing protein [Thalassoroseus pseudoceratinae]
MMKFLVLLNVLVFGSRMMGAAEPVVRVAVFQDSGTGASSTKLIDALQSRESFPVEVQKITAEEIQNGRLDDVDVLVHPGGSGSKQGKALGELGRENVRQFVRGGGGYLGVCAGAYLATNDYSWSLNLIDAKVLDRLHWARGTGAVKLRLSPQGTKFFESDRDEISLYYGQGPLLARREWDDPKVPNYESLAIFASEIAKKGAPRGVMIGTSAAVRCQYGDGRVFCYSPHPESTEGQHHLIPIAVEWLTNDQP